MIVILNYGLTFNEKGQKGINKNHGIFTIIHPQKSNNKSDKNKNAIIFRAETKINKFSWFLFDCLKLTLKFKIHIQANVCK